MAGIWTNILSGFKEIFSAPLRDISILWLLIPIILFWFVLEIYFGKYKGEKLGWYRWLQSDYLIQFLTYTAQPMPVHDK